MTFFSSFDEEDPAEALAQLKTKTENCTACALKESRIRVVFGEGAMRPDLLCLGEAPAEVEDKHGKPFIGPTGYLLDECLREAKIPAASVYKTLVVMCRPEDNRKPDKVEIQTCSRYLLAKISSLRPRVILAFGLTAATALLKREFMTIEGIRKTWYAYGDIPLRFTYTLPYILKPGEGSERKIELIDDFKAVRTRITQTYG